MPNETLASRNTEKILGEKDIDRLALARFVEYLSRKEGPATEEDAYMVVRNATPTMELTRMGAELKIRLAEEDSRRKRSKGRLSEKTSAMIDFVDGKTLLDDMTTRACVNAAIYRIIKTWRQGRAGFTYDKKTKTFHKTAKGLTKSVDADIT